MTYSLTITGRDNHIVFPDLDMAEEFADHQRAKGFEVTITPKFTRGDRVRATATGHLATVDDHFDGMPPVVVWDQDANRMPRSGRDFEFELAN